MPSEEIDLEITLPEDSDESGDDTEEVDDEEESDSSGEEGEDSEEESSEEDDKSKKSDDEEEDEKDKDKKDEDEEDKDKNKGKHSRPSFRDVKTAFPEFFKKFPDLRDAFFREREYTKVFPTVDDAKEALAYAQSFGRISQSLMQGDPSALFTDLAEANPSAFRQVALNLLPTIHRVDKDTFFEITTPLLERFVQGMDQEGVRTGDINLRKAALLVGKFLTGELKIPDSSSKRRDDPDRSKFEQEKSQFFQTRHEQALQDLHGTGRNDLTEIIDETLSEVEGLTKWQRQKLSEDILLKVDKSLAQDERHQALMSSLLRKWVNSNYSIEAKKRIVSAYLSRAKQLVEPTRDRVLKEAMKKKVVKKSKTENREDSDSGSERRSSEGLDAKKIDWRNTSDKDFLDDKVTLRK